MIDSVGTISFSVAHRKKLVHVAESTCQLTTEKLVVITPLSPVDSIYFETRVDNRELRPYGFDKLHVHFNRAVLLDDW